MIYKLEDFDHWEQMKNQVIMGDALELLKRLPDNSVDLAVYDLPYNIGKDTWDTIDNYFEWVADIIKGTQRVLKDNGSFYFWHNDMMFISKLMQWMENESDFIFKQFIVWNKRYDKASNKGFLDGFVVPEDLRNYQKMAEYCLFYTFQDETGLSKIMGNCVYPIRDYIRNEIIRAKGKIVFKKINQVLGTATNGGGVGSDTLSLDKTVPAMMTKEHYLKLRDWLNETKEYEYLRKEYEDLRKEYEDLRKEYEDLRYSFNNQKTHHSVWEYEISKSKGHSTPKPMGLIRNIIKHSSNVSSVVLDITSGSFTTAKACQELGRDFIGCDLDESYCKIGERRLSEQPLIVI